MSNAGSLNQFLRFAVLAGADTAVRIHIARGDDLNARDANGMTPLMLCAARNNSAICSMLLQAGADQGLLDRSGKTALELAIAAGSNATAAVLKSARGQIAAPPPPDVGHEVVSQAAVSKQANAEAEIDTSAWTAEEEPTRPEVDPVVLSSARAVQIEMTTHELIDSSTDWLDIDAYLPERAQPLARTDPLVGSATLRRLLLRALREGSVPRLIVQDQCVDEDRSADPQAEHLLSMVINDLGAEIDERIEYSNSAENFEVFVDPEETPDEEAAIDEALSAIDRTASLSRQPLRMYQRDFQRLRLLTAEEEIQLAKDMEAALGRALDALARWPDGIARTLAAGNDVIRGTRPISSLRTTNEPDPLPSTAENTGALALAESEDAVDDSGESANTATSQTDNLEFAIAFRRLAALFGADEAPRASSTQIRRELTGLNLSRSFLLDLADSGHGSSTSSEFAHAMADYRNARDRMTTANLKLSFHHAKKHLYSGEPLDDLAQEGNMGLLKAVDRYDWRRGFRFSTYATWWIRQQIGRYIADRTRTIRIPVHVFEKLQRLTRMSTEFETALGRSPNTHELAELMVVPHLKLAAMLKIPPEPEEIDPSTIDGMIAIDARTAYVEPDPEDVVGAFQMNNAIDRLLSELSTKDNKEERVLRMRFGLGGEEPLTLEEIGKQLGVTRERIRQIEAKAIERLKHPSLSAPFARNALGLTLDAKLINPEALASVRTDRNYSTEQKTSRQKMVPQPRLKGQQAPGTLKTSALDRLLAKAVGLGIRVDDNRLGSGEILVEVLDCQEKSHHSLVRQLLEFGFTYLPGRGFRR